MSIRKVENANALLFVETISLLWFFGLSLGQFQ